MNRNEPVRRTYCYEFVANERVVVYGFTTDLKRRETEHQRRWPDGHIKKVDGPMSHQEAWTWEQKQKGAHPALAD